MILLRWLFVLITPAVLALVALIVATIAFNVTNSQCDPVFLVAGKCVEPWHTTAVDIIIHLSILFMVAGVVIVPALIAPRFKKTISIVGFLLISIIAAAAYFVSRWPDLQNPLIMTLLTGAVCVFWMWKKERRNNNG